MSGAPMGVGIIGTGMISTKYLDNLTTFPDIKVVALGDLDVSRAAAQAEKYGVPVAGTPEDVLTHPDVELVINLTIPVAHVPVSLAAVEAGKHVWSEKPIGVNREEAQQLLTAADAAGVRVGIAPDTILGPAFQTALRALRRGDIGVPLSAQTTMQYVGPDLFHPAPEFLFGFGGGPVADMGPYYMSAMVNLFGPVARVAGVGLKGREKRTILVGDRLGSAFDVEVPTHVQAIAQFESGMTSQSVFSFDSHIARTGILEVIGTEGTLVIPDPNRFVGEVRIARAPEKYEDLDTPLWSTVENVGIESGRGLGVLDMARSIRAGLPHIATGELGYHVFDALMSIEESVALGQFVDVASTVGVVPLVPEDRDPFAATL
ncbi:Gfo/Idh/MocA family protein [Microbacterium sp. YY-03]|uniref:Gfo/Idh/MocA family protein n=1 Tax=Microbacterium sp. YY-03 TaxID=3421636 RepID=UPI003D187492